MNLENELKSRNINEIDIVGKGQSARFYKKNKKNFSIGFNLHSLNDLSFDLIYSTKTESDCNTPLNVSFDDIKEYISEKIMTGSVEFELGYLLIAIDKIFNKSIIVNLYGFDFRFFSIDENLLPDKKNISNLQRRIDIESQNIALINICKTFKCIKLKKFGFDLFSDYDPRFSPILTNDSLDPLNHVEIVAEITTNHFGDLNRLLSLIQGAARAGADSVKLQMRDVETFYNEEQLKSKYDSPFGKTFHDYRLGLELTESQIKYAIDEANKLNINLFFSALDLISYKKITDLGIQRVKLPSTISNKKDYLLFVSKNPADEIVISTGMTDKTYIDFILKEFKGVDKLFLLHCISSYPTFFKDTNINIINLFSNLSKTTSHNLIPGYSSHDIGFYASILAIASGAKMIEKHIKIGITEWGHFDDTAMDINTEFTEYVSILRKTECMLGSSEKKIYPSEHHKY